MPRSHASSFGHIGQQEEGGEECRHERNQRSPVVVEFMINYFYYLKKKRMKMGKIRDKNLTGNCSFV